MLYFRALQQGLSDLPPADGTLRARLESEAEERGWPALHARLAVLDPAAAARIHPNDPQRIQRALEVCELTGRPLSELQRAGGTEPMPFDVVKLHILPTDRADLHKRIEARFHRMLDEGLLAEVEALHARGDLEPAMPALRAVGYRQLWQYLDGELDYRQAVQAAITATRQLAKRQMTWMRGEREAEIFAADDARLEDKVLKYVRTVTHYQS
jgi:tRNA dimethylallyltransferase